MFLKSFFISLSVCLPLLSLYPNRLDLGVYAAGESRFNIFIILDLDLDSHIGLDLRELLR